MSLFGRRPHTGPGGVSSNQDTCDDCSGNGELYVVTDDVWFRQARARSNNVLCIPCLERRLRRRLTVADFSPYALCNDLTSTEWPKSALLRDRLRGWVFAY